MVGPVRSVAAEDGGLVSGGGQEGCLAGCMQEMDVMAI